MDNLRLILMAQYDAKGDFVRFGWYNTALYCRWHNEHPRGTIILDYIRRGNNAN